MVRWMGCVGLVLFVGCSGERPPAPSPPQEETPAETPAEAPILEPAEIEAGRYLWEAGPFEERTFEEAAAHCVARDRVLLGHNEFLAEHMRHLDVLRVSGVFWSSAPSPLDNGSAWAVELNVPLEDGPTRAGVITRPTGERHPVRCARANPNPPAPDTTPGSCDTIVIDSECMQHDAEAFENLTAETRAGICTSLGSGTYRREVCPTDGLVGRCPVGGGQLKHYYAGGGAPFDEARAREDCDTELEPATP